MSLPSKIEFHNVAAVEPSPSGAGWILPRYPREVYETFPSPGFMTAQESTGVELRFVTAAPHLRIFLSPQDRATEVTVFRGDFLHFSQTLSPGVVHSLHLTPPDHFGSIQLEALHHAFHPDVWRVLFCRGTMVFHGIDSFGCSIRPPLSSEKPAVRWLAYGSSITHSSRQGYPQCAAHLLGVDVQNKGMSGSCFIDDAAVDFIADGCEWDIATLEIGINMRVQYPIEEFERRARNLLVRCMAAKPGRPIALITMFRNAANHLLVPDETASRQAAFDEILRTLAWEHREKNIHLIEGTAIVDNLSVLSSDLLHPTDNGHARMAENLAKFLKPLIADLPSGRL